jgi:PP-loop superfamily ATP-utilizing enzyme
VHGDANVLVGVLAALRGEDILLVGVWHVRVVVAVLEHNDDIIEDKVYYVVDIKVMVELAERVGVEHVLVPDEESRVGGWNTKMRCFVCNWCQVIYPKLHE